MKGEPANRNWSRRRGRASLVPGSHRAATPVGRRINAVSSQRSFRRNRFGRTWSEAAPFFSVLLVPYLSVRRMTAIRVNFPRHSSSEVQSEFLQMAFHQRQIEEPGARRCRNAEGGSVRREREMIDPIAQRKSEHSGCGSAAWKDEADAG